MRTFSSLLITILTTSIMAQSGKPTVAILDFEGQDVSASEVQTLTERMRTEIGNTNAVRLIERKAVEKIMAEQGFQQTGCTSDECAAEVGQLLGVQFMVSGTIGKVGKTYTIDCKMFSLKRERPYEPRTQRLRETYQDYLLRCRLWPGRLRALRRQEI